MKITVTVKTNTGINLVEITGEDTYKVYTTATPEKGKANTKILQLLADFLDVPVSSLTIVFGKTSREKIIQTTGN